MKIVITLIEDSFDWSALLGILVTFLVIIALPLIGDLFLGFLLVLSDPMTAVPQLIPAVENTHTLAIIIGAAVVCGIVINIPKFFSFISITAASIIIFIVFTISLIVDPLPWYYHPFAVLLSVLLGTICSPLIDLLGLVFSVPFLFFGKTDRSVGFLGNTLFGFGVGFVCVQILKWFMTWVSDKITDNSDFLFSETVEELYNSIHIKVGLCDVVLNLPWFVLLFVGIALVFAGISFSGDISDKNYR